MNWGHNDLQKSGRVQWSAPSNIAIVKYWGKKGIQEPLNPSVSFSLNNARTITSVDFEYKGMSNHPSLEVFLDGVPMPSFKPKIETFLLHLSSFLPWVNHFYFRTSFKCFQTLLSFLIILISFSPFVKNTPFIKLSQKSFV